MGLSWLVFTLPIGQWIWWTWSWPSRLIDFDLINSFIVYLQLHKSKNKFNNKIKANFRLSFIFCLLQIQCITIGPKWNGHNHRTSAIALHHIACFVWIFRFLHSQFVVTNKCGCLTTSLNFWGNLCWTIFRSENKSQATMKTIVWNS